MQRGFEVEPDTYESRCRIATELNVTFIPIMTLLPNWQAFNHAHRTAASTKLATLSSASSLS